MLALSEHFIDGIEKADKLFGQGVSVISSYQFRELIRYLHTYVDVNFTRMHGFLFLAEPYKRGWVREGHR